VLFLICVEANYSPALSSSAAVSASSAATSAES